MNSGLPDAGAHAHADWVGSELLLGPPSGRVPEGYYSMASWRHHHGPFLGRRQAPSAD